MKWYHAPFLLPLKVLTDTELWEEMQKILWGEAAEESSDADIDLICPKCGTPAVSFRMRSKFVQVKRSE